MKKKKIEELISEYLCGELSPEQEAEFKEILRREGYDLNKLSEYREIYSGLTDYDIPEPRESMHRGFYSMLEDCKKDIKMKELHEEGFIERVSSFFTNGFFPKLAYGLSLLVIGWVIGHWFTPGTGNTENINNLMTEMQDMKKVMMLTMLERSSAVERMKAVKITNEFEQVDEKVINALLETLNSDPNVNVRLVTVETLYSFADNPKVREGLIQSITVQESPLVQLALADVMLSLKEKKSLEEFEKLIAKKNIDYAIKTRIQEIMRRLS